MFFRFFAWHYIGGTKKIISVWRNFIEFIWKFFSVRLLMGTLFFPWKRDVLKIRRRGFHPILWVQSSVMNLLARIIGSAVRLGVIASALFLELLAFILALVFIPFWFLAPFIFIAGLVGLAGFLAALDSGAADPAGILWAVAFGISGFIIARSFLSFRNRHLDYDSMELSDLASCRWFDRVWKRVGVDPASADKNIFKDGKLFNEFLNGINLSEEEFQKVVDWEKERQEEKEKSKKFWLRENLLAKSPIGKNWAFAYTVNLDRYAMDLSEAGMAGYSSGALIGKDRDLEELKLILSRPSQNSVVIVGEAGVGKDTIVGALAQEIRTMQAGDMFNNKRILSIDLKEIFTLRKDQNDSDGLLQQLFSEAAYAGNIIIYVKNIHQYLKNDPRAPEEDISSILANFLPYPDFRLIATTTPAQFHADVEKKTGLMKYLDKIQVDEMSPEEAIKAVWHKLIPAEERRIIFTYQGLRELVKLSVRYINTSPLPEKALDLLEEVLIFWKKGNYGSVVDEKVVADALSNKIKVPLGEISQTEGDNLLNLEKNLHKRVVGQDYAISQIAETMRRARVGMASEGKPLGSFLFMGPTGVGKTESVKALAESYFGDENRMIRLDMSEYQTPASIDRLIGSPAGKEGYLTSKVKESPYSILLLDEIEKAYPDILNLFLQVLDEGYLNDAFGQKISFNNLIIIATTNAGAEIINAEIKKGSAPEQIRTAVLDHAIKEGIFRPEFLNRFEGVIFFHSLNKDNATKITRLLLDRFARKLKKEENIDVKFEPAIVGIVSEKSYDPVFGARAIDRYIQDKIGDTVVKKIISGGVQKGGSFVFGAGDLDKD